jgi:hypothetical protein
MLNIEVLLFQEPRTLNEFAVEIEEKGGNDQKIVISQSLPSSWLSMTHFVRAFKNIEGEDGIAWKQARKYHLHDVQNLFGQEDQKAITMKQVPFHCDSDFWCGVRIKALGSGLIAGRFQGRQKKKSRSLKKMMTMKL